MTNIWIMRKSQDPAGRGGRRVMVRADAITYLSADDHQVRATELGSDNITVLADKKDGGHNSPPLPEGFNADMLYMVSDLRRQLAADGDSEDHVLIAQTVDGTWEWRTFAVSEIEPKSTL
ncbi:hypothetical protein ACFXEL_33070 [Streptomyces sp. NPDC059382]|uniref:hypothetical protein n=1 Tax=Streptomyces sp. NPDC059382 TaxID=3346816 RepID=UPI0036772AA5